MSVAVYNQIGRIKNYHLANIPITATRIFTASKNLGETVLEILICNKINATRIITIQVYRAASATSFALAFDKSISGDDVYRCDFPISMLEGDEIRLTAGTATSLDGSIAVSEGIGRGA